MTEVECPVDGCGYQDAVRSVKAHITASTDHDHDGMHGMDAADSLREQANSRVNGELPRLDDAVGDPADSVLTRAGTEPNEPAEPEQADAGSKPGDEPDEAGPVPAPEPGVEPGDEIEAGDTDDTGEFGIPVPVDANYIVIGTALVVAILVFRSGAGSNNSEGTDGDDAPTDDVVVQSGGLVR
jgi:hypothetical protein